jgi:hypothetical protein
MKGDLTLRGTAVRSAYFLSDLQERQMMRVEFVIGIIGSILCLIISYAGGLI